MQPVYEKIAPDPECSFHVTHQRLAAFDAPWHYHSEIELTWIMESRGRRFVGDSVAPFREGELVLLGPALPHFWQNCGRQPRGACARSLVVQFDRNFLGEDFWHCGELRSVKRLLERASRGLIFSKRTTRETCEVLEGLPDLGGMKALMALGDCLDRLASDRQAKPLTTLGYAPVLDRRNDARLVQVFNYATRHFRERLTLPQLARAGSMSPAAFSRYFKRATGRAPSDFLNDLRIEHACRLLRESSRTIADIAGDAGFTTLTNFNRRFRERTKMTPRVYRGLFS